MATKRAVSAMVLWATAAAMTACGSKSAGVGGSTSVTSTVTSSTTSTSKGSTSTTSTGGGVCGPDFFKGDACHTCGEASCCTEKEACAKDSDCASFTDCISLCDESNHACYQACVAAASNIGDPVVLGLRACLVDHCASSCSLGDLVRGGGAAADPACDAASLSQCCQEITARNTSADALTYLACANGCGQSSGTNPWDCIHACRAASPGGAVLADAAAACQQEKAPVCNGNQCVGASTIGTSNCAACQSAHCCAEATECDKDGRCFAEGKPCVLSCQFGDVACVRACADANPTTLGALGALLTCTFDQCPTECFAPVASQIHCAEIGYFDPPTCGDCLQTSCCSTGLSCKDDPECDALAYCVSSCTDAACESACEAAHPGALTLWAPYHACRTSSCSATCGGF